MAINKRIIRSNDEAAGGDFNTVVYSGNEVSGTQITGVGFQPDFVWIKDRGDGTHWHNLFDSVRGASERLFSNTTNAESFYDESLQSFDSDGFTVGLDPDVNRSGTDNMVAWCWKAGGAAVTNTDGTITSQVSANTEAGFSVVSYTGTGSSNTIVGTGLDTECDFVIIKNRNNTEGSSWVVQRNKTDKTKYLYLNDTRAESTSTAFQVDINTNNGTFKMDGTSRGVNSLNDDFIAYCFAEVAGFSKFGSYTGTGSAGNTVTVGFEPAFIMLKRTDATGSWFMFDNKRNPSNPRLNFLRAQASDAEASNTLGINFLSNGFDFNEVAFNDSGATFIYMAFANQF